MQTLPKFVKRYCDLAKIFGVSNPIISRHAKKNDAPLKGKRGHSVDAWSKYISKQPKRNGWESMGEAAQVELVFDDTLTGLKAKKIHREIQEKELKIGKVRGELIEIDRVRTWAGRWQSAVELIFSRMKSEFIPRVCGMEIGQARKAFDKYVAAEFDRLRDSSSEWDK